MDIRTDQNGIVMGRVSPNRIHTHIPFARSRKGVLHEGYSFALLREEEIAILIFQGIRKILTWLYAFNAELARAIGS